MKNRIYLIVILFITISFFHHAHAAATSSASTLSLFKIGFEFQESHHMCPWAVEVPEIQSKPIFSVCQNNRVLWDITIDWQDLEFVTMPIANHEMNILDITMISIQIACDALVELNERASSPVDVTFKKWVNYLEKLLQSHDNQAIKRLSIKQNLICSLSLGSFKFPAPYGSKFNFKFQPQVTVQHHLESSINLCLGLFVEDITYLKNRVVIEVEKSGILKDFITNTLLVSKENGHEDSVIFQKHTTPQEGFLFLHMITCIDLSGEKRPKEVPCGDLDISRSTEQTQTMCLLHFGSGQVNAKSSVNFLSRRPFSSMWKEIAQDKKYADFLKEKVSNNFLSTLAEKFEQVNYGEIFFTEEGERMNLAQCLFSRTFKDPNIQFILEQGILTLEFIRILRVSFLENYFENMVKSVSNPEQTRRCVFDKETKTLRTTAVTHDLLSPPHLSSEKDSMGAFKDDSKHDPDYGQAIVEFRGISNIPQSALEQITALAECDDEPEMNKRFLTRHFNFDSTDRESQFCKNERYDLQMQAKGLFLYIEKLINGEITDD